ncbi:MAG: C39 family peptidase [Deltaproteobacteria bacterium]|nr:C39 family peptidase [Deltaproteobacteria bacterium]
MRRVIFVVLISLSTFNCGYESMYQMGNDTKESDSLADFDTFGYIDIFDYSSFDRVELEDYLGVDLLDSHDEGLGDDILVDIYDGESFSGDTLFDSCVWQCLNKECGDNGCGGFCGVCSNDEFCNQNYKCEKICKEECPFEGALLCTTDGRYRECIRNDKGCLVYSEPRPCPHPNLCSENECAKIEFLMPSNDSSVKNPVEFKIKATSNIKKVIYDADGYLFGSSDDPASGFYYKYNFTKFGSRVINANGYDGTGNNARLIAKTSIHIVVLEDLPDVPYFCQYKNSLYPSSTCQNTSIAMLLKYYGWNGKPDDITNEFGKDYAQSPSGLAEVFNILAKRSGIPKRLIPHENGTVQDVKNLLSKGLPVIVHGYFTSYGHVLVILGYRGGKYIVNDPAGKWSEIFKGGYDEYCDLSNYGPKIEYSATAFEKAIATWDGFTPAPVWYHEVN